MWMVGSLRVEVDACQVGALEQDEIKGKLDGTKVRSRLDYSNEPKG